MAIFLHRLPASLPPLTVVTEQVMGIPEGGGIPLANSGLKIVVVLKGSAHLMIDGEDPYRLAVGDVIVLLRACRQQYRREGEGAPGHIHVLLFQYALSGRVLPGEEEFAAYLRGIFSRPRHLKAASCISLRCLTMRLRNASERPDSSPWLIAEIARQFVFEIARHCGIHPMPPLPAPWSRAEEEHLRLLRTFRAEGSPLLKSWIGMPASRYRSLLLIEEAKELMAHELQPISAVSRKLGFSSPSVFSRTFHRLTGIYPKAYQQRLLPAHEAKGEHCDPAPWEIGAPDVIPPGRPWKARAATLLFCLRGSGVIERGGELITLSDHDSDLVLLPAGSVWKLRGMAGEPTPCVATVSLAGSSTKLPGPGRIHPPRRRELEMARVYWRSGSPDLHGRLYSQSLLRLIASDVVGPSATPSAAGPSGYRLPTDYAVEYLRKHLDQPVRLSDVAWFSGVSEEHLSRSFRQVHGTTIMDYLKELRLDRAAGLLAGSAWTVTDIAARSGFGSPQLFCREFRKYKGCTPMQYRQAQSGDCQE